MSMKVFVIICSVLVIVGFTISCYLMTTVNPEPIVSTEKPVAREREFVFDFENMQDKDDSRDVHYGLEKANPPAETPVPLPYLFRKNLPKLLSTQKYSNQRTNYPSNQLSVYSHLHVSRTSPMMAPLPNSTLTYTCQHGFTHSQGTELPKNNTGNNTEHAKVDQPVKGRRRSINSLQKRFGDISGSIILKIVDGLGKSRVEIKVDTEDSRIIRNKNSSIDNNSAFATDDAPQDFLISLDELPDRTEIRILPNSSLVVSDVSDAFDSKLDISTENISTKAQTNQQKAMHTSKYNNVNGHNGTIAVISRPGSNGSTAAMTVALSNTNHAIQRTTQSLKQLLKTASTGELPLKILFDNVARSLNGETNSINRYTNKNADNLYTVPQYLTPNK